MSSDSGSSPTVEEDGGRSESDNANNRFPMRVVSEQRHWRDVFWLLVFFVHLVVLGIVLTVLGINRFRKSDRLDIDKYTYMVSENQVGLTETYWPIYGVAGGIGAFIGVMWLLLLGSQGSRLIKFSVHILNTYLAVISVLCFWSKQLFWGIAFAVGASIQFLYVVSVIDRIPFTMLILQKAVKMVWNLPEVMRVAYAFIGVMLCWLAIWSFGAAGVVASSIGDSGRWWLLVIAVNGKNFNHSARDAWELFQSTGVETLVAYDCSGPVLLMGTIMGGLVTGTCAAVYTWCKWNDRFMMVGTTSTLMGMILVGLALVVVESAVTSIYICFAEDPSSIQRWDAEFFNQMSEALHQRLQYRSARARARFDQRLDNPTADIYTV